MAKKNRAKAQRMASRGAAPKQIAKATGVSRSAARNIVSRAPSRPADTRQTTQTSTSRAPKTGGDFNRGFVGDFYDRPNDFGRDPFASVNSVYTNAAGTDFPMSARENVRDPIYTNYENNNYKWLGSDRGMQILKERYSSPEQALNTKIGSRQHDMAGGDWGAYLSMIGMQNGQVGLGAIQKAKSRGATQDQLDRFFTHSGLNVGQAAKDAGYGTNPYTRPGSWNNPLPGQTAYAAGATPQGGGDSSGGDTASSKIRGLRQGLRIAGVDGITRGEFKDIAGATGKSDEKIIQQLDKLNKKIKDKGQTGISLNSGAANRIIKRATKTQGKGFGFMPTDFGQGRIGRNLQSRLGTPGSSGTYIKGQLMGAKEATAPSFLEGGMQIRPGGRERVRGFGKQYSGTTPLQEEEVVNQGTDNDNYNLNYGEDLGGGGGGGGEAAAEGSAVSSGAGGLDLASWATGFRRARSSRQKAGRKAQGLASQKKSPFSTWNA